jgi:hypothetical protein
MKTNQLLKSLLLFFVLMGTTSLSFAASTSTIYFGETSVKLTSLDQNKAIVLNVLNKGDERMTVTITDGSENILSTTLVDGKLKFTKQFDLSQLPSGIYFIKINKSIVETVQPFTINAHNVEMDPAMQVDKYLPVIKMGKRYLDINLIQDQADKVKVIIKDASGEVVFSENLDKMTVLNRRYDLSGLDKGIYKVEIKAGSTIYRDKIEVKSANSTTIKA